MAQPRQPPGERPGRKRGPSPGRGAAVGGRSSGVHPAGRRARGPRRQDRRRRPGRRAHGAEPGRGHAAALLAVVHLGVPPPRHDGQVLLSSLRRRPPTGFARGPPAPGRLLGGVPVTSCPRPTREANCGRRATGCPAEAVSVRHPGTWSARVAFRPAAVTCGAVMPAGARSVPPAVGLRVAHGHWCSGGCSAAPSPRCDADRGEYAWCALSWRRQRWPPWRIEA